jgi:hypothetical protein
MGSVSRASRFTAAAVTLGATLLVAASASAHRLDEYLQAARLEVEPDHVELELDLTPGVAVAPDVVGDIDCDRDGTFSPAERTAYAARVLDAIVLQVDGQLLHAQLASVAFADADALRRGEGTIQLRSRAPLPSLSRGRHEVFFRNLYHREGSVYMANALVPDSDRVRVTAQHRDGDQSELTIDYLMQDDSDMSQVPWWLVGVAGCAVCVLFGMRRHVARLIQSISSSEHVDFHVGALPRVVKRRRRALRQR